MAAKQRREAQPGEIAVSVEADGITPATISTEDVLRLLNAYVRAIGEESKRLGLDLSLVGLETSEGSFDSFFRGAGDDVDELDTVADSIEAGMDRYPGLTDAVSPWPDGAVTQRTAAGLRVLRAKPAARTTTTSTLSARAKLVRVGGTKPRAMFALLHRSLSLSVGVTEDEARELGGDLYRVFDIRAFVTRDEAGAVRGARLRDFVRVGPSDYDAALRWIQETGRAWADVDDPNPVLGRGGGGEDG